jgi:ribosomal protein L11 methylase PrmA
MLTVITYFLVFSLGVFILAVVFLIQGPPYVQTDDESAMQIIGMVKKYKGKRILDMGSGDGKLVILLAKEGFKIDGIELNPLLVLRSRKAIRKAGVEKNARIYWGNFWSFDTSDYDMVVLYVIKHIMPSLEKKLERELKPGSHIISNFFVFPKLKPVEKMSRAVVYKTYLK